MKDGSLFTSKHFRELQGVCEESSKGVVILDNKDKFKPRAPDQYPVS